MKGIHDFLSANADYFEPLKQKSEAARQILKLCKGAYDGSDDLIILYGLRAHENALAAGLPVHAFFICPTIAKWPAVADVSARFMRIAEHSYTVTERTFARMDGYGDPDGILSLARLPMRSPDALALGQDSIIFVLDGLTKPGNVGVILRSCDGAGVSAVMVCNLRTHVTHPNAIKASMGAAFSVPIVPFPDAQACKEWLTRNGFTIYIADPKVENRYDTLRYAGRTAVVMGNEHIGACGAWYDGSASPFAIPMNGSCDSLNVSVAASILAYEIRRKRGEPE